MVDFNDAGRWAAGGRGSSVIPDTYPVLQLTALLHDPCGPIPSGEQVLRDGLVDRSELGIGTKRLNQNGSRLPREIPKQAMVQDQNNMSSPG